MLKKFFALAAVTALVSTGAALADDTSPKKPGLVKQAGTDLKKGAAAVVHGSETVAKDSVKTVEKGAKLTGKGVKAGAKGTETVGKDLVKGTEAVGKDTLKGAEKVGAGAEHLVGKKTTDTAPKK